MKKKYTLEHSRKKYYTNKQLYMETRFDRQIFKKTLLKNLYTKIWCTYYIYYRREYKYFFTETGIFVVSQM